MKNGWFVSILELGGYVSRGLVDGVDDLVDLFLCDDEWWA